MEKSFYTDVVYYISTNINLLFNTPSKEKVKMIYATRQKVMRLELFFMSNSCYPRTKLSSN